MKAIKIKTNSTVEIITLQKPIYKALQKEVGGLIDYVRLGKPFSKCLMIVDDEGLLKRYALNEFGTDLYGTGQPIVGDVVIVKNGEHDFKGFKDQEAEDLKNQLVNHLIKF